MRHSRCRDQVFLPILLISIPLLTSGCEAGEPPGAQIGEELRVSEAGTALVEALTEASTTQRLVLLHTGADW